LCINGRRIELRRMNGGAGWNVGSSLFIQNTPGYTLKNNTTTVTLPIFLPILEEIEEMEEGDDERMKISFK
jgi:hypothetical protein